MLAVILTLLIGTLCGIDLYLKSYIETHYKEGEEKKILGDTISVRKVHNKGMALNKGEEHPKRVRMLSGIVTALLVLYYVFLFRKKGGWMRKKGIALAIAGGVSNTYDRFVRKYVVDYFGFCTEWKKFEKITFNLGDMFIFLGSILVVISEIFFKKAIRKIRKKMSPREIAGLCAGLAL